MKIKLFSAALTCALFTNTIFAATPTLTLNNLTGLKLNIFTNELTFTPRMLAAPKGISIIRFPTVYSQAAISFLGYTKLGNWARCSLDVTTAEPHFQIGELGCQGYNVSFKATLSGNTYTITRVK